MATEIYLKLSGDRQITGESKSRKRPGWLELRTWKFDVEQKSRSHAQKGKAAQAEFGNLKVTKAIDSASPMLMQSCAEGVFFKEVLLEQFRAGTTPQKLLSIKLESCFIEKYEPESQSQDDVPTEEVQFNYVVMTFEYYEQGDLGHKMPAKTGKFDQRTQKANQKGQSEPEDIMADGGSSMFNDPA